jgi:tRNA A37 N6-isopentenylltransferase MiaA
MASAAPVIFICGPTGSGMQHTNIMPRTCDGCVNEGIVYSKYVSCVPCSGKTAVSIRLAQELGGEVVNADAFQMYKGLNIATAKITEDEVHVCHWRAGSSVH